MVRSLPNEPFNNLVTLCPNDRSRSPSRLAGLTIEESIEFVALDKLPPFDDNGSIAWTFEGGPTSEREKRWLELYRKHKKGLEKAALDRKAPV
jgi:hypothetical protein